MNWRNERNENVVQLNAIQLPRFLLSSYLCSQDEFSSTLRVIVASLFSLAFQRELSAACVT